MVKKASGKTNRSHRGKKSEVAMPPRQKARSKSDSPRQDEAAVTPSPPAPVSVVGVGASAGGLEAFTALLRGLPARPGLAIVFVQHLAPQHESALVTLLTGQSTLPVVQATEGMQVEADHVYVIPPNTQMTIDKEALHLRTRPDDRTQYTPIDSFLTSLAQAAGNRAIGVVLSGTASDGALGVRDVKAAGGVTVAQTPSTAKYDGMPRAAIATGMVDLVLPPEAMGIKLAQLSRHAYIRTPEKASPELPVSEAELKELFDLLRPISGVDFRHYKMPTIKRRLFRRMALHRLNDVPEYLRMLRNDAGEVRSLYQDLLIHVTRFFREPESFEALTREVFPALVEGRQPEQPIRVWVSGCATGEEAYSVGIALTEFLQRDHSDQRIQIFATDVSEAAIEHARAGVYPSTVEADVSPDRLRRFFAKHDGSYRVSKMIRDLCVFARQDLTKDPPFSRLDLILCRNVLIYMDTILQKKLLSVFHYALNPNGFLVLGQAETVGAQATLFSLVDKKFRIHRRKATSALPTMTFPVDYSAAGVPAKRPQPEVPNSEKLLLSEVSRVLMDRFAPPGVVVDGDMQIVQFRGQTGMFLEPAPGDASLNLLKMAREGLLYGLRTALHAARKTRNTVHRDGLQVRVGDGWKPVALEVIPLAASGRMHYLVLFDGQGRKAHAPAPRKEPPSRAKGGAGTGADRKQFDFLQRELAASREYLQSIIQELEAANEELQSANEEILSSNEELQSTNEELDTAKEELQSTNEELNTVNEEMHGRNEELSRVNSDLLNLLGSVQIAIVIVNSDLRIRRFTPMAEKVLNLIPADLDRSIAHINPNIDGVNLEQLITECIDSIALIEREVRDRQGHWYSLRVRPYRSVDNKIDGAVLSLFDIDAPKCFEETTKAAVAFAEAMVQTSPEPMVVLDDELRIKSANDLFAQALSLTGDGYRGRPLSDVALVSSIQQLRTLASSDGNEAQGVPIELRADGKAEGSLRMTARAYAAYDGAAHRVLVLTSAASGASSAGKRR
ncbi:MAG TPA: chemotaxis protein CheB [Vicinamibacterales bacterium]|nr:chemotaxis protein CheB [Vicinamibacterales bacterium]